MSQNPRADAGRAIRTLRGLAWTCVVLMLVVTSVSAWLRLAQPRPACDDWPACRTVSTQSSVERAAPVLGSPQVLAVVRAIHRLVATVVLLAVIALVVATLRQRPRRLTAHSFTLLGLALGLSVLGIATPGSTAASVLLGNLLGGLAMLALAWHLTRRLGSDHGSIPNPTATGQPGNLALPVALLWTAQVCAGALSGAGALTLAPDLHIILALATGPLALVVGGSAYRAGQRGEGTALMLMAALQPVLGGVAALFEAPAGLVLLHNIGAAVGIALLAGLVRPGPYAVSR